MGAAKKRHGLLEEATIQRRVFAWQGADTEPLTGTEADSPGAGWTITRDDVVVLIEQLRNAAGAVVAFVELQVDGKRTTHRGWVDPASLKRRPGDETEEELALRREQLADIAGEHLAGRAYAEAYHAFGDAIAADPANHLLYGDRALCCARLHKETPSPELPGRGPEGRGDVRGTEAGVSPRPRAARDDARALHRSGRYRSQDARGRSPAGLERRRGERTIATRFTGTPRRRVSLDTTLAPTDAELADSGKAAAPKTRGAELFARGDMENAADKYRAALAWDATDDRIWANRAACFSRLRRFDEALRDAEYACRLSPRGARAHHRLAEARLGQGRVGDAHAVRRGAAPGLRREDAEGPGRAGGSGVLLLKVAVCACSPVLTRVRMVILRRRYAPARVRRTPMTQFRPSRKLWQKMLLTYIYRFFVGHFGSIRCRDPTGSGSRPRRCSVGSTRGTSAARRTTGRIHKLLNLPSNSIPRPRP